MEKATERSLARKIVRQVGIEMKSQGFLQSKPTFIVRKYPRFVQFVHFHKFRFGPYFRIHLGIRVLNDSFEAPALNGPCFEHAGNYDSTEEGVSGCVQQLTKLIKTEGGTWFESFSDVDSLLNSKRSPLGIAEQTALREDVAGKGVVGRYAVSEKLLGLTKLQ